MTTKMYGPRFIPPPPPPTAFLNHAFHSSGSPPSTFHSGSTNGTTITDGTAFTPTAGNLLLVAITSPYPPDSFDADWTFVIAAEPATDFSNLYLYKRTASGDATDNFTLSTPVTFVSVGFDFFEFSSTATVVASQSLADGTYSNEGPTVSGLTGTTQILAFSTQEMPNGVGASSWSFASGTICTNHYVAFNSTHSGYNHGAATLLDNTASSVQVLSTSTYTGLNAQRITVAVQ